MDEDVVNLRQEEGEGLFRDTQISWSNNFSDVSRQSTKLLLVDTARKTLASGKNKILLRLCQQRITGQKPIPLASLIGRGELISVCYYF